MQKDFAIVEQTPTVLKLLFQKTSRFVYLMFGIPFVSMSGCGLLCFFGAGLVFALVFASAGRLREGLAFLAMLVTPILMIGLFLAIGIWLIRQGTKSVIVEAELWTFDKQQQQFSVTHQYHDRRTLQRWSQVVQTYPMPAFNAVSLQSGYEEPDYIVIWVGNEKVKSPGSYFSLSSTVQQIVQFLKS